MNFSYEILNEAENSIITGNNPISNILKNALLNIHRERHTFDIPSYHSTERRLYCVYLHYIPKSAKPFYVGKGTLYRAFEFYSSKRSRFWESVRAKYCFNTLDGGPIVRTILFVDESKALEFETLLISILGRRNNNTGCLVNLTDGGEGASGAVRSDGTKRKMSRAASGRVMSEVSKQKMSVTKTGKFTHTQTNDTRCKIAGSHGAFSIQLTHENGAEEIVFNRREFCRKYYIERKGFADMLSHKRKSISGWSIKK